jgi:hypothetical protein
MRVSGPATIAISLLLVGCTGPTPCLPNVAAGITVRALEAGTEKNVTDGARGTVAEGTYVDSLRPAEVDAAGRVQRLSAADERAGTYGVFVERPGYQAVSLSGVEVTAGDCHVHTVALDLTMVPIP